MLDCLHFVTCSSLNIKIILESCASFVRWDERWRRPLRWDRVYERMSGNIIFSGLATEEDTPKVGVAQGKNGKNFLMMVSIVLVISPRMTTSQGRMKLQERKRRNQLSFFLRRLVIAVLNYAAIRLVADYSRSKYTLLRKTESSFSLLGLAPFNSIFYCFIIIHTPGRCRTIRSKSTSKKSNNNRTKEYSSRSALLKPKLIIMMGITLRSTHNNHRASPLFDSWPVYLFLLLMSTR